MKAEFYHLRAVELRAIAEMMVSENKERLLKIADDYDRMAEQTERLNLENGPGSRKPKPAS